MARVLSVPPRNLGAMAQNFATDPPHVDPQHLRAGEGVRREAPAAQSVGPTPEGAEERRLPSVRELDDAMQDTSGDAVSAQPFDSDAADLADARERVEWDADTDRPGA